MFRRPGEEMNGDVPPARVLELIPYGLYVVGSLHGPDAAAMVANWLTQVSFAPPCVAMAVEAGSRMRVYIADSGLFSVNILPSGARATARAFLKGPESAGETIGGRPFERGKNGTPFLTEAAASFECRVKQSLDVPDHTLFVGEVVDAVLRKEGEDVLTLRETGWRYQK